MLKRSLGTWVALGVGLICALAATAAMAESHVRIVRLSEVQGAVEIDRNTGQGYEKATANMPLVEGMKLAAKADGRSEVEFEDGSTVRITPNTKIEFTALSLQDSGAKVSTVTLTQGLAYVDYTAKQKDNVFTVIFKDEKVRPEEAARFRVISPKPPPRSRCSTEISRSTVFPERWKSARTSPPSSTLPMATNPRSRKTSKNNPTMRGKSSRRSISRPMPAKGHITTIPTATA